MSYTHAKHLAKFIENYEGSSATTTEKNIRITRITNKSCKSKFISTYIYLHSLYPSSPHTYIQYLLGDTSFQKLKKIGVSRIFIFLTTILRKGFSLIFSTATFLIIKLIFTCRNYTPWSFQQQMSNDCVL